MRVEPSVSVRGGWPGAGWQGWRRSLGVRCPGHLPDDRGRVGRARDWIGRGTEGELDGVLVVAEGTGSYGAVLEEGGYRVVEVPRPGASAAAGRLTPLDAVLAARSTLAMPLIMLRDRCAGEVQAALQVLTVARISSTPTGFGASTRSPL